VPILAELSLEGGVRLDRWRCYDDVLDFCRVPVFQLGYHVDEFCPFTVNGGKGELSFGLCEPKAVPVGLEGGRRTAGR
jgi:hypothetical protein